MTKPKKLECPNCNTTGEKEMHSRICISEHPDAKPQILSGAFFEWTCPGCKRRFFIEDIFLYNDDENKFMVYLISGYTKRRQEVPTLLKTLDNYDTKGSTLRVSSSFVDFVEKIRILQVGLDDRVVETMKAVYAQIYSQNHDENVYNMLFEKQNDDDSLNFSVFFKDEDFAVDIPLEAYKQAAKDFSPLFGDHDEDAFVMIDQSWLADVLKKKEMTQNKHMDNE